MTNPNLTWILFLLDRSGSMRQIKKATEEGFDAFITEQRKAPGQCAVTLAQFDTEYEVVYSQRPLDEVPPLTLVPRNSTALLDSMANLTVESGLQLAELPEAERPGTVIVAIMTDGLENASREWTHPMIKELVQQQTEQYGWQFLYMGANQDAIEEGAKLGVSGDYSLDFAGANVGQAMTVTSQNVVSYRSARSTDLTASMPTYTAEQRRSSK
ncbi:hypothetical protein MA5S0422_2891 [Mycobacteroides abscessus 5S-0422]|uniref:von Willebrand factor type A domain protein n=1 Tax=Mycobacteroides abscessus subsp. bolletii 1513 TaxID=1299321 RepID=X8DV41_9MYCO|nr:vWA domain-containing protein [Mycobacteroides abscessus]EUA71846.1 von Willebrand factor type A domain protein [Mycobacteroides abscessus subsp. bolletii 1513]EIU11562.1 hypothetical protein MA5S0304_1955 [Mycobacteroides abscessus 5S-0304]EIU12903.1 hypothetical protein MA5S0421_2209 [Mycobacteroides abscessus 5S-0421]EIU13680.1 hypothetical protein MA5S0422_2891 [Mycobacteroides abscessus 5S-0422]EIU21610.1 hypothetical protein MA5S0708_4977 [Mycobacteroides abscessus 5S-0708]